VKTNLTCADCERELTAYLDGELSAAVARVLESHVTGCARCARSLGAYRAIAGELALMPELPAPAWLEARVVGQVTAPERARRLWRGGLAAAAALSFAGAIGILAVLPRIARLLHLPDPAGWPHAALSGIVSLSKSLAQDVTFYLPFLRPVGEAVLALESLPRAVLLGLRTPEAQMAGVVLITLGGALYFALRPSRTHERGIGHACLSL
jgi:hypothetical protein